MKMCKKCSSEVIGRECKPCKAKYMREWNAKNPDKVKNSRKKKYFRTKKQDNLRSTEWAKKNRERSNEIKKAYKERNREKYLAQQRESAIKRYIKNREDILKKEKSPDRKELDRTWREKNKERLNKKYLQNYHNSDEMKMKHSARNKVRRAIKNGNLIKAEKCLKCGMKEKLQAHHMDYLNPLEVIWLCISCHKKAHSKYVKLDLGIIPDQENEEK